jgi:hypothetical protein
MSIRQPVSLKARRAFCPSLPIASDICSDGTITVATRAGSSRVTLLGLAGESALAMNWACPATIR